MKADVTEANAAIYAFEEFRLDAGKRLLLGSDGGQVPLVPKAFEILLYLISNAERVVEKDELMTAIWPETAVEENNLTQNVSSIRKALGERRKENRFIATVPGRGYKFVADVRHISAREPLPLSTLPDDGSEAALNKPKTNIPRRPVLFAVVAIVLLVGAVTAFLVWRGRLHSPGTGIRSIAVLPFKPLTSRDRNESLEMGMADTLILKLSGVESVKVRPLTAVRRFSAPDQDALAAGREMGVDAVLDGRLQSADDRIRATVQLLRVSDGEHLWSGQFDEKLTDLFSLQDSIAQRVASQLRISLGEKGSKRYTDSVEAYQFYVIGNLHVRRLIKPEVEKGLEYYQKAIEADPQFALAYIEIANANRALVLTSDGPPTELMPRAKAAALRAVELDGGLAEAWTALAVSDFWYEWNWRSAEEHHRRALDLDSANAPTRTLYAHLLSNIGRHDEAVREIKRAREIEPASLITNAIEGQILFFAGEQGAAEEVLNRTVNFDPKFWLPYLFLTRVYLKDGRLGDAITAARQAADLSGGNAEATATIAYSLAMDGRPEEARTILAQLVQRSKERYVPRYTLAQIHLALGERDEALNHLNAAFEGREALMTFLKVDPKWNALRDDPRFTEILRRMNFD